MVSGGVCVGQVGRRAAAGPSALSPLSSLVPPPLPPFPGTNSPGTVTLTPFVTCARECVRAKEVGREGEKEGVRAHKRRQRVFRWACVFRFPRCNWARARPATDTPAPHPPPPPLQRDRNPAPLPPHLVLNRVQHCPGGGRADLVRHPRRRHDGRGQLLHAGGRAGGRGRGTRGGEGGRAASGRAWPAGGGQAGGGGGEGGAGEHGRVRKRRGGKRVMEK